MLHITDYGENYVSVSIDAKTAFDKIHYSFMLVRKSQIVTFRKKIVLT